MFADHNEEIKSLEATLGSVEHFLDLPRMETELAALREQAGVPNLWDDPDSAQQLMSRMSGIESDIERVAALRRRLDDVTVMIELAADEEDEGTENEVISELAVLKKDVDAIEVRTLLSGEYDERQALVSINPGAGGVDSQDWAEMLLRMYLRWCEQRGFTAEVYETQYAEEAGIKSATFAVKAAYAYGLLHGEHGVHRLVRISPFDNQHRRQTSFAAVDVTPVVEATDHVEIDEKDLRIDVYRSSGPGGQGVNTTDSAVRLTHLPTGLVVSCQNERSQIQNRATAMTILAARLLEVRRREADEKMNAIRGGRQDNSFGSQIRNYVLHPYQMVKDLRTEVETGNTGAVLDGEIDMFVEAEIRWAKRREEPAD